jgi:hypothetical protein
MTANSHSSANGYGSAVIQIMPQYNILGPVGSAFNTTFVNDNPNGTYVKLTVCTRYTFICKTSGSGF